MIVILPNAPSLGKLELIEVYEYFDGPKLYSCKNGAGQIFFSLWIGEDEIEEHYYLVPASFARFIAIRSGSLAITVAFAQPELGYAFRCSIRFVDASTNIEPLLGEQLDPNLLPDANERLDLTTETMPVRFSDFDLPSRSVATRRDIIGLHLDFKGATREEAPIGGLGRILMGLQESVDALGQQIEGKATLRGSIGPEILAMTETQVVHAGGGSFALEISAAAAVNLFNRSLITDAIDKFVRLVGVGNNVEELRALLIDAEPRAASKYKKFLSALVSSQVSIRIERASPDATKNTKLGLGLVEAAEALKIAEQVTREVGETRIFEGVFLGIEIPRKTFLAVSNTDESVYRGKILLSALAVVEHIRINEPYLLKIRETIEVTLLGEERLRYELEAISEITRKP